MSYNELVAKYNPHGYSEDVIDQAKQGVDPNVAVGKIAEQKSKQANFKYVKNTYKNNPKIHDKDYNTILNPDEEVQYQKWKGSLPKQMQWEGDYDLRGMWKYDPNAGAGQINGSDGQLHFSDTWKKPNHRLFTTGSVYDNKETPGGEIDLVIQNNTTGETRDWRMFRKGDPPQGWHVIQEKYVTPQERMKRDIEYHVTSQSKTQQVADKIGKVYNKGKEKATDLYDQFVNSPVGKYLAKDYQDAKKLDEDTWNKLDPVDKTVAKAVNQTVRKGLKGVVEIGDLAFDALSWMTRNAITSNNLRNQFDAWKARQSKGFQQVETAIEGKELKTGSKAGDYISDIISDAAAMGIDMFVVGGLAKTSNALLKNALKIADIAPAAEQGANIAVKGKGVGKGLKKALEVGTRYSTGFTEQLAKGQLTPLQADWGFAAKGAHAKYVQISNLVDTLEKNGIPADATDEEKAYYKHLLDNKDNIKQDAITSGLLQGMVFAGLGKYDISKNLFTPLAKRVGLKGLERSVVSKAMTGAPRTLAMASELGGVVQGATHFGALGTLADAASQMTDSAYFDKSFSFKQLGKSFVDQFATGAVMGLPRLTVSPYNINEAVNKAKGKIVLAKMVDDHIEKNSKGKNLEHDYMTHFKNEYLIKKGEQDLTSEEKDLAKKIVDKGSAVGKEIALASDEVSIGNKSTFVDYATALATNKNVAKSNKFDADFYNEHYKPLVDIMDNVEGSYDPSLSYNETKADTDPHIVEAAEKFKERLLEQENLGLKPQDIDRLCSLYVQKYKNNTDAIQKINQLYNDKSLSLDEEAKGFTDESQTAASDLDDSLHAASEMFWDDPKKYGGDIFQRLLDVADGKTNTKLDKKTFAKRIAAEIYSGKIQQLRGELDNFLPEKLETLANYFKRNRKELDRIQDNINTQDLKSVLGDKAIYDLFANIDSPERPKEKNPREDIHPDQSKKEAGTEAMEKISDAVEQGAIDETDAAPIQDGVAQHTIEGVHDEGLEVAANATPSTFNDVRVTGVGDLIRSKIKEHAADYDTASFMLNKSGGIMEIVHMMDNRQEGEDNVKTISTPNGKDITVHINDDGFMVNDSMRVETFGQLLDEIYKELTQSREDATEYREKNEPQQAIDVIKDLDVPIDEHGMEEHKENDHPADFGMGFEEDSTHGEVREILNSESDSIHGKFNEKLGRGIKEPRALIHPLEQNSEFKAINDPLVSTSKFKNGKLSISKNWREKIRQPEIREVVEELEKVWKHVTGLKTKSERNEAIQQLKGTSAWEHMVSHMPINYNTSVGDYYLTDATSSYTGILDGPKNDERLQRVLANREAFIEKLLLNGGELEGLKVERAFVNHNQKNFNLKDLDPNRASAIKLVKAASIPKYKHIYGGTMAQLGDWGAEQSFMIYPNKIGDDHGLHTTLAGLIYDNALNGGRLKINEKNQDSYGINTYGKTIQAQDIIDAFVTTRPFGNGLKALMSPENVGIFDNVKGSLFHIDNNSKTLSHLRDGIVNHETLSEEQRPAQIATIADLLYKKNFSPNFKKSFAKLGKLKITADSDGFGEDFNIRDGETIQEALFRNGVYHTDIDLNMPYRDSQMHLSFSDQHLKEDAFSDRENIEETKKSALESEKKRQINQDKGIEPTPKQPEYKKEQKSVPVHVEDRNEDLSDALSDVDVSTGEHDIQSDIPEAPVNRSAIPDSYTLNKAAKAYAHTILKSAASDLDKNSPEFLDNIKSLVKKITDNDLSDFENNPERDREVSNYVAYRKDLLDNIDAFASKVANIVKTNFGLKSRPESFAESDVLGETMTWLNNDGTMDPFVRADGNLMAVMGNLNSGYNSSTTFNEIANIEVAKQTLLNALGGKFSTKEEMMEILDRRSAESQLVADFLEQIRDDENLKSAAFTAFNKEKESFSDMSFRDGGMHTTYSSESTEARQRPKKWMNSAKSLINTPAKAADAINAINELLPQHLTDDGLKVRNDVDYNYFFKDVSAALSLAGIDVSPEQLSIIASNRLTHEVNKGTISRDNISDHRIVAHALLDSLHDPTFISETSNAKGTLAYADPLTSLNNDLITLVNFAGSGMLKGESKWGEYEAENHIASKAPVLYRLSELVNKFAGDDVKMFVRDTDGKRRYLYKDPSYLSETFQHRLNDADYVYKKLQSTYNKQSVWLNAIRDRLTDGDDHGLKYENILRIHNKNGNETSYSKASPQDIILAAHSLLLDGKAIQRQIAEKSRMGVISGFPEYQDPSNTPKFFSHKYFASEYQSAIEARRCRGAFLRDTIGLDKNSYSEKDVERFNNLSAKEQEALNYDLSKYGMVEGYHYKYVPEFNEDGVQIGNKLTLNGNGYNLRYFNFIKDALPKEISLDGKYDEDHILSIANDQKHLNAIRDHLEDIIGDYVTRLEEYGIIDTDGKSKGNRLGDISGSKILKVLGGSRNHTSVGLAEESIRESAKSKVTKSDTDKYDRAKEDLLNYLASSSKAAEFRRNNQINDGDIDKISEMTKNGTDFSSVVNLHGGRTGTLEDMSAVGNFLKKHGYNAQDKYLQNVNLAGDVRYAALANVYNMLEMSRVFEGDPAFYKGYSDQTKRMSGMVSSGQKFNNEFHEKHELYGRTNYKRLNIHDAIIRDKESFDQFVAKRLDGIENPTPEQIKKAKEDVSFMLKSMTSDGQSFVSPYMAREMAIRIPGMWSEAKEKAFKAMMSGAPENEWANEILTPVWKCMNWGPSQSEQMLEDGTVAPLDYYQFHKTSYAPLFPSHYKGTPLEDVVNYMVANDIGVLSFESSTKVGGSQKMTVFDGNGNTKFAPPVDADKFVTEHSWDDIRWQLPFDPHAPHEQKVGIQIMKAIFDGATSEQKQAMHNHIKDLALRNVNPDIAGVLSNTIDTENQIDNVLSALENGGDVSRLNNPELVKNVMGVFNDVLQTKVPGGMSVQISHIGMSPEGSHLRMQNDRGKMEIVTNVGRLAGSMPKGSGVGERKFLFNKLKEDVGAVDMFDYRVPTQTAVSGNPTEVVGVVADTAGDVIYLPHGAPAKMGVDNDGDKMFYMAKTYKFAPKDIKNTNWKINDALEEKFKKYISSPRVVDKASQYGRGSLVDSPVFDKATAAHKFAMDNYAVYDEKSDRFLKYTGNKRDFYNNVKYDVVDNSANKLLDSYFSIYKNKEMNFITTSSVDAPTQRMKDVMKETVTMAEPLGLRVLSVPSTIDTRSETMGGGDLIGAFALMSSMKPLLDEAYQGKSLMPFGKVKIYDWQPKDELYTNMWARNDRSTTHDKDGGRINDLLVALSSAAVDSPKDPILLKANINNYTKKAVALLAAEGHGDASFVLAAQPIVFEHVRQSQQGEFENGYAGDAKTKVLDKYIKALKEPYPKGFDTEIVADKIFREVADQNLVSTESLKADAKKYKEFQKNGTKIENWGDDYLKRQIYRYIAFLSADQNARQVDKYLVINNLDKGSESCNDLSGVHRVLSTFRDLNQEKDYSLLTPERILDKMGDPKLHPIFRKKFYGNGKMVAFARQLLFAQHNGVVDLSNLSINTVDHIAKALRLNNAQMRSIAPYVTQELWGHALTEGADTNHLYYGDNTLADRFQKMKTDGIIDPSNIISRMLTVKGDGIKTPKYLAIDSRGISEKRIESDIINGFREFAKYGKGKEGFNDFMKDFILHTYIANGARDITPHLIPSDVIDKFFGDELKKASDVINGYNFNGKEGSAQTAVEEALTEKSKQLATNILARLQNNRQFKPRTKIIRSRAMDAETGEKFTRLVGLGGIGDLVTHRDKNGKEVVLGFEIKDGNKQWDEREMINVALPDGEVGTFIKSGGMFKRVPKSGETYSNVSFYEGPQDATKIFELINAKMNKQVEEKQPDRFDMPDFPVDDVYGDEPMESNVPLDNMPEHSENTPPEEYVNPEETEYEPAVLAKRFEDYVMEHDRAYNKGKEDLAELMKKDRDGMKISEMIAINGYNPKGVLDAMREAIKENDPRLNKFISDAYNSSTHTWDALDEQSKIDLIEKAIRC